MNSVEYQDQARRLNELRRRSAEQNSSIENDSAGPGQNGKCSIKNPLIASIPGIYSPSGFGIIDILLQVYQRPNPQIEIGNVNSGVALLLCGADVPDHPIVYCSEAFERLTAYNNSKILGHNCRFLQQPSSNATLNRKASETNEITKRKLQSRFERGEEVRTSFVNFRRDGTMFTNNVTLVPIRWDGRDYIVGFQADEGNLFR